jgi:Polyketide cyclase / dehydrase and lipid transport
MRTFLLVILGLFVALNLLGLFLNPRIEVHERLFIAAPPAAVHAILDDLEQWPRWNPLFDPRLDGKRAIEWGEARSGAGARLRAAFPGDAQVLFTLIASDPGKGVEIETLSGRKDVDVWAGQGFRAIDALTFEAGAGGTWVRWSRRGQTIAWPLLRVVDVVLFRRVIRHQLERGLAGLKSALEGTPVPASK